MKLTPIELNIRASWAINCAIQHLLTQVESERAYVEPKNLFQVATKFLLLLDRVKAHIEPPLHPETGKSKPEQKDISKLNAELDAGSEYPN